LVLAANVSTIVGGVEVFRGGQPDDGLLELGVVTAENPVHWTGSSVGSRSAARSDRRSSR
jgi:hypothetical protein